MHTELATRSMPRRLCAGLVTVRGRIVLVIGGEEHWRHDPGCVFVPLELPGGTCTDERSPTAAIAAMAAIGQHWLGRPLRLQSASITYGPSAAHAIDRLPPHDAPAPLLFLQRLAPADPEQGTGVHRVTVEVFAATVDDGDEAGDDLEPQRPCAGLALLSWDALRQMVRGLPLTDLRARADVTLRLRSGVSLPPQTLVYLTSEYGERTLLRVAAKYGVQALGKDLMTYGTGI